MQFEYTDPQTELEKAFGGHYCINAFGKVEPGDDAKFGKFLASSEPPPRTTVYIDSIGGDVDAAIGIGRAIRAGWFHTNIGKCLLKHGSSSDFIVEREFLPGRCLSAATLIYLGGRLRYFQTGSEFGVHQFSFRDPSPDHIGQSQMLSAKIARYVVEMGISPDFLEISSSVRSAAIKFIEEHDLKQLEVVTGGQTDVSWSVQARGRMLYVRGERDSLYGHHKVMLSFVKSSGFIFWAVIEAQGREDELTGFPVVEIVIDDEDRRIDISDRSQRVIEGLYVNVLARLTQEEAREIAYSNSFGVQIRLSKDAPIFFGVSAMSTESGKEQLETFYSVLCEEA